MRAICTACGEDYPRRRKALGYDTCLTCGEQEARAARAGWCVAPIAHKQAATLITHREQLKWTNKYAKE